MEIRLRRCKRCVAPLLLCESDDGRRLYCRGCSPLAGRARRKKARDRYRESPEGKAQHAAEEKGRRQRRKRESVGDRHRSNGKDSGTLRCQEVALVPEQLSTGVRRQEARAERPVWLAPDEVVVAVVVAPVEATSSPKEAELAIVANSAADRTHALAAVCEVVLVFPRALRTMAKALLGTSVACCVCGRGGLVARLRQEAKRRRR